LLRKQFSSLATYKSLKQNTKTSKKYITGLNSVGKLLLLAQIAEEKDKKIVYVIKNDNSQATLSRELKEITNITIYTYPDLSQKKLTEKNISIIFKLEPTLSKLLKKKLLVFYCSC